MLGCIVVVRQIVCTQAVAIAAPMPPACVGDCNQDHEVSVDELVVMVNIALDRADLSTCPAGDRNDDHRIEVDDLVTAVNAALNGCSNVPVCTAIPTATPSPTLTPSVLCGNGRIDPQEECDQGNVADGDGCDSHCRIEPGYQCGLEPSVCIIIFPCIVPNVTCSVPPATVTPTPTPTAPLGCAA
jgi:cysteine-rich repeat protein